MERKHKHYDCIVAWAEGKEIEYKFNDKWYACYPTPNWDVTTEYRVKPKITECYFELCRGGYSCIPSNNPKYWDLKITYSDSKAIKAELPVC